MSEQTAEERLEELLRLAWGPIQICSQTLLCGKGGGMLVCVGYCTPAAGELTAGLTKE